MVCESCGEKPKNSSKDFTRAVLEINNPEQITLLRKVVIPVSMGTEEQVPAAIGKYYNVILHYEANGHTYLYSSDGIPTQIQTEIPQEIWDSLQQLNIDIDNEEDARKAADKTLQDNIDAEAKARGDADIALDGRLTTVEGIASTALQPSAIDKVVMTDISLNANSSTTTVQIDGAKENLLTGTQTTKNLPLPVASHDAAGVMNSSTFDAVANNTSNISALMNGAVAITGLSASPSQSDLTTAWETETGLTSLMNRAGIYDVDNNKVWTYYSNTSTWYAASNTSQVTVNTFTNSSEGTIKGSTNVGQVFAESDGTGSINGWDTLSGNVSTNTNNISSLQTGKQDKLTAGANITISAQNVISADNNIYTAGNAITIDSTDNNRIDAAVYPADFFTAGDSVSGEGTEMSLQKTIKAPLKSLEVKGDTFQQTYSGTNLFDVSTFVMGGMNNGQITTSTTRITNITMPLKVYPNTTYTISVNLGDDIMGFRIGIHQLDTNKGFISDSNWQQLVPDPYTFTTGPNTEFIGIVCSCSATSTTVTTGTTESNYQASNPTQWLRGCTLDIIGDYVSPSPDHPQDIQVVTGTQTVNVHGKNLFNFDNGTLFYGGNISHSNDSNSITMTASGTLGAQYSQFTFSGLDATKTYTISGKAKKLVAGSAGAPFLRVSRQYSDDGINWAGFSNIYTNDDTVEGTEYSFNGTVTGHAYWRFLFYNNGAGTVTVGESSTYYDIQLEEGPATTYEPYQGATYTIDLGSIELCKIGDYQDYIYKSGDDWYVHKENGKQTYTGSQDEAWASAPYGTNSYNIVVSDRAIPTNTTPNYNYSNLFRGVAYSERSTGGDNIIYNDVSLGLYIRNTTYTSVNDFKTMLSTTNLISYYVLATPTDTKITDSTLIGELEALRSMIGATNILVTPSGTNLAAILDVEAYRNSLAGILAFLSLIGIFNSSEWNSLWN